MTDSSSSASPYHHGDLKRTLVNAATALVAEEQDWAFSLREVARRAGVSHNAPYRHFPEKLDLLAAVAALGYEALRDTMRDAAAQAVSPDQALIAIGAAYVRFGTGNPARYRLMFGAVLSASKEALPEAVAGPAAQAEAVLSDVIRTGAMQGQFAASPEDPDALALLALSAWAIVHGLTLLTIDGLARSAAPDKAPEDIGAILLEGIRKR